MKNLILCGVLFCAMTTAGCIGHNMRDDQTQQRAERFQFSIELPVDTPVTTKNIELVGVSYTLDGERKTFQALIGPNNPPLPAQYSFHHSNSTIQLQDGWAYLSGDQPMGEAQEVSASTESTTIILQVLNGSDPNARISRVFLIQMKDIGLDYVGIIDKSVPNPDPDPEPIFTSTITGDRYVEKIGQGPVSKIKSVSDSEEISNFVRQVKVEAIKAGILEAGKGVTP